jgi:GH25 family lysozyme M1 (1,4-beta-N-acetylmuramidase)
VGASGAGRWWLDVETDNTWGYTRNGVAANIAVVRGALDELRGHAHVSAGIYTETTWWTYITGATTSFSHTAVWGGGANSKRHARLNCRAHSITGGPALLAQWISSGIDHDIAC